MRRPRLGMSLTTEASGTYRNLRPESVKSTPLLLISNEARPGLAGGERHITADADTSVAGAVSERPWLENRQMRSGDSTNPLPCTVTIVPPIKAGPSVGHTRRSVSASVYSKATRDSVASCPLSTTSTLTERGPAAGGARPPLAARASAVEYKIRFGTMYVECSRHVLFLHRVYRTRFDTM